MAIYVPHSNVESDESFGQAINKLLKEYINPELRKRMLKDFKYAGIEIFKNGKHKVYLDSEVNFIFTIERRNIKPRTKVLKKVDLKEIKEINWDDSFLKIDSAKIVLIRFTDNWWIYHPNFNEHKNLEDKFKVIRTLTARDEANCH